jgi:hypothetical protein
MIEAPRLLNRLCIVATLGSAALSDERGTGSCVGTRHAFRSQEGSEQGPEIVITNLGVPINAVANSHLVLTS